MVPGITGKSVKMPGDGTRYGTTVYRYGRTNHLLAPCACGPTTGELKVLLSRARYIKKSKEFGLLPSRVEIETSTHQNKTPKLYRKKMANPRFTPMSLGNETSSHTPIIVRRESRDCDEEKVLNLNHRQNGLGNNIGRCCPHYESPLICTNRYSVQNLCNKIHAKCLSNRELDTDKHRGHQKTTSAVAGDFETVKVATTVQCPHCQFLLDISHFADSPQVFCHYCGTIFTKSPQAANTTTSVCRNYEMRACERCGFYIHSKPHRFPFAYYQSDRCDWCIRPPPKYLQNNAVDDNMAILCQECMQKQQEKYPHDHHDCNLLNFCCPNSRHHLDVVPVLASQTPLHYAHLEHANALVKGTTYDDDDIDDAIDIYQDILKCHETEEGAGIRYNMGLAYMTKCDWLDAIHAIESSVDNCSNFEPAYYALSECYKHVDTSCGNLAQLQKQFATDK